MDKKIDMHLKQPVLFLLIPNTSPFYLPKISLGHWYSILIFGTYNLPLGYFSKL